jgi:hypothetical protein
MSLRRLGSLPKARLPHRAAAAITLRMPKRRARVSLLYRSKRWLTLAQFVPVWASELAGGEPKDQVERHLWHYIYEDIINGRFDGPEIGQPWGLLFINGDKRPVPVRGWVLIEKLGLPVGRFCHRLLVAKAALLDFARRHDLPLPSWWADPTSASKKSVTIARLRTETSVGKRGVKPVTFERVKRRMREDINEGRQTIDGLRAELQKKLAATYGVSRETACKARDAVLSEIVGNSNRGK